MGEVWLAEHRMLARPVALKLIHSRNLEAAQAQQRERLVVQFEQEAQALAALRSPYTIQIFDFGVSDGGDLFYVMELLDGVDLYGLVSRFGPQPLDRVLRILICVARSLAEAHERGLTHRDIKPANIYLCRQADALDVVKVLDFGLAQWAQGGNGNNTEKIADETLEGTPAYMAPEQVARAKDDQGAHTDLYALALVGWYLITGKHLFQRKTVEDTLRAQFKDDPPPIHEVTDRPVPEALEALLKACLAKRPSQRPENMRAFIDSLTAIQGDIDDRWDEAGCAAWWKDVPGTDFSYELSGESISAPAVHKRAAAEDDDGRTIVTG
jgi:serine/threonine-protein kinase